MMAWIDETSGQAIADRKDRAGAGARVTRYLGVGEIPGRFCNRKSSLHTLSLHSGNPPVHSAEGPASKIW